MGLTLLRHTTPAVAPGTCYGATDLALSDDFEVQAARVFEALPEISCILSSPLRRCAQLADRLAAWSGGEVRLSNHWREMDFGNWEGQSWKEIPRAELDAWAADFMEYRGHGGESVADLAARVETGLQEAPEGALIVTHMGCIKAALSLRGDPDGWQASLPFGGRVTV